ncbi:kinase-like domain-containing protein [Rhizophagus diaphanus]|nr:kinase-like domain-containing protein [Rhizophagus diaphanus] [Rhizophagus sp. MUCL 43196]
MRYIPYSQITNVKKIAEGGFSIIYQATCLDGLNNNYGFYKKNRIVILKRFKNLQYAKKYSLKELESNHRCYKSGLNVNKTFGFTKDPKFDDYILTFGCPSFKFYTSRFPQWKYIEIFKGSAFSKESDNYSLGMIMWELTTGCKPFANVEHDHSLIFNIIDGVRPEITEDTPECYANLMKSCWDSDPKKRLSIWEIFNIIHNWLLKVDNSEQFYQAELKGKIFHQMITLQKNRYWKENALKISSDYSRTSFASFKEQ